MVFRAADGIAGGELQRNFGRRDRFPAAARRNASIAIPGVVPTEQKRRFRSESCGLRVFARHAQYEHFRVRDNRGKSVLVSDSFRYQAAILSGSRRSVSFLTTE
jgi:hypothetical protein